MFMTESTRSPPGQMSSVAPQSGLPPKGTTPHPAPSVADSAPTSQTAFHRPRFPPKVAATADRPADLT